MKEWIKWLQVRIPVLKEKPNEFWLKQAMQEIVTETIKRCADNAEVKREFEYQDGGENIYSHTVDRESILRTINEIEL